MKTCSISLTNPEMQTKSHNISFCSNQIGYYKRVKYYKCWHPVERRELLCIANRNTNQYSHDIEDLQKSENKFFIGPNCPTCDYVSQEMKSAYERDSCIPISTAAVFTIAKIGSPTAHHRQMMDKENIVIRSRISFSH